MVTTDEVLSRIRDVTFPAGKDDLLAAAQTRGQATSHIAASERPAPPDPTDV